MDFTVLRAQRARREEWRNSRLLSVHPGNSQKNLEIHDKMHEAIEKD